MENVDELYNTLIDDITKCILEYNANLEVKKICE